jgi:two-component sensor histidine kinase
MINHELINNATRHAFDHRKGKITVELALAGAFIENRVLDNGAAAGTAHRGRGLKIINELSKGLQGRFEWRFGSRGSTFLVAFPLRPHPHRSRREAPETKRLEVPEPRQGCTRD